MLVCTLICISCNGPDDPNFNANIHTSSSFPSSSPPPSPLIYFHTHHLTPCCCGGLHHIFFALLWGYRTHANYASSLRITPFVLFMRAKPRSNADVLLLQQHQGEWRECWKQITWTIKEKKNISFNSVRQQQQQIRHVLALGATFFWLVSLLPRIFVYR